MSSLAIEAASTALVLVDLQHGIVARELAPHTGAQVVSRSAQLAQAFRARGGTVVYVRVLVDEILKLPVDTPTYRPLGAPPLPANACELVPEAGVQPGDVLIVKKQWGAFYGTDLEQQLRRRGIRALVMAGIATNFGIESTARQAYDQGFELIFAEDAMSTMARELHDFSVQNIFPKMGRVRSTEQVLQALDQ
ncbi:hydrolase [Undibacterium sp. TJN25]|uniref:hydrolase n=1 Tax=Undibacterium sp. TJN25 TaxID=3413056 RepID=UPI003BEF9458